MRNISWITFVLAAAMLSLTACTQNAQLEITEEAATDLQITRAATATDLSTPIPSNTPEPEKSDDVSFMEQPPGTLRVLSYNVNWDAIFPLGGLEASPYQDYSKPNAFLRLIRAINPDIVCLQEISPNRKPVQVAAIINEALGESGWHAISERDNVIASHFEIIEGYEIETNSFRPELPQAAALVDLADDVFDGFDIFVTCSHFKAAGSIADILLRERQADVIMNNIRDFISAGGNFDGETLTPFLVMGDFNVYSTEEHFHLTTLTDGDISNEGRYGEDFAPDWDSTSLEDALPSHNGLGEDFYTWREDQSFFDNDTMDRIIFSDSVLAIENSFVLNTTLIGEAGLSELGLEEFDVMLVPATGYYDHLPLVVDFSLKTE